MFVRNSSISASNSRLGENNFNLASLYFCLQQRRFQLDVTPSFAGKAIGEFSCTDRSSESHAKQGPLVGVKLLDRSNRMIQSNVIDVEISKFSVRRDIGSAIH